MSYDLYGESNQQIDSGKCECIAKRYKLAIIMSCGFFIISLIGTDLMSAFFYLRFTQETSPELMTWDNETFLIYNGIKSVGYMVSAIAGGVLTMYVPANRLLGISVGFSCLINMLIPPFIMVGTPFAIATTFVQALFKGLAYPSLFVILKYWAPPCESSFLLSIVIFGDYFGRNAGLIISFYAIRITNFWMSCFLIYGSLVLIWLPFWIIYSCDKPELDYKISTKEFDYILMNIKESDKQPVKKEDIPWHSMVTSKPLLVLLIVSFCSSWNSVMVYTIIQYYFISYTDNIRGITTTETVLLLLVFILIIASGVIMDILKYKYLTTTIRKVFTSGGLLIAGILCVCVVFSKNSTLRFILLTGYCIFHGFELAGTMANQIDISPRFVGITVGICSAVKSLAVISIEIIFKNKLKSLFVDYYMEDFFSYVKVDESTLNHDTSILIATAIINIISAILYAAFASGENQNWKARTSNMKKRGSISKTNSSGAP